MNFSILIQFIEHIDIIFSWKFLFPFTFLSFLFLGLSFISLFHDILQGMLFKYILLSCIVCTALCFCKFVFQFYDLLIWKKSVEKEKQRLFEKEQISLNNFLHLSKKEIAIIKYLFYKPALAAWLPPNLIEAIMLIEKGYLKVIAQNRKFGGNDFSIDFCKSQNDLLCTLSENTTLLIKKNHAEISQRWQKLHMNKILDKYQ